MVIVLYFFNMFLPVVKKEQKKRPRTEATDKDQQPKKRRKIGKGAETQVSLPRNVVLVSTTVCLLNET